MSDEPGRRKRSAAKLGENEREEVARLREQLAASNQQRQQLAASNLERDQQLAAMEQQLAASNQERQQLAASNQKLAASNQQLAASNQQLTARNERFQAKSIFALLNKESESGGLFTFKCQGNNTSHTNSNSHLPATADPFRFILERVALAEEWKDEISMLMAHRDSCGPVICYQSEADISVYTRHALSDAIKLVSLVNGRHLACRHEQSIFSQRPDHLVVYDVASNLPIIAVEDKKPAPAGIWTPKTAGQVFDYAVSMQCFGHKAPFVVLTSVEETFVTWLDETLPKDLANGQGRIEAISMNGSSPSVERFGHPIEQAKETPSPPNLISGDSCPQSQNVLTESQAPASPQPLMFKADAGRKFCCSSSKYNSSELTRVLYSVILCGLQGLDKSSPKSITRFTPPSECDAYPCLELSAHSYSWGTLSLPQRRRTRSEQSPSKTKKCYVVGIIGSGNTSKVFHAVDLYCQEYAIKMYVKRFNDNTCLNQEAFEDNGRRSVTSEVEFFKSLYPNLKVVHKKLNKHHCVIMPLFDPVPKDERESRIEDIKNVLKVFASKKLKYKDEDVRWRHVGLYEGKCILYDLEDLEASTSDDFVAQHIKTFKSRANLPPHSTGQAFSSRGK